MNTPEQNGPPSAEESVESQPAAQSPRGGFRTPSRRRRKGEVSVVLGAVFVLAALPAFEMGAGFLQVNEATLLTAALLYLPLLIYLRREVSLEEMGATGHGAGRSLGLAGLAGGICLPLFAALWFVVGGRSVGLPDPQGLSAVGLLSREEWARLAGVQLIAVAGPEEWFFRGYLQSRLSGLWSRQIGIGPLKLSVGALAANGAFAAAHAVRFGSLTRLNVFFPGLLFAWVAGRSGNLLGAIVLHAASNLLLYLLAGPPPM